jgi:hypothetical protein
MRNIVSINATVDRKKEQKDGERDRGSGTPQSAFRLIHIKSRCRAPVYAQRIPAVAYRGYG